MGSGAPISLMRSPLASAAPASAAPGLAVFVHQAAGYAPGLYLLEREPGFAAGVCVRSCVSPQGTLYPATQIQLGI